MKINLLFLAITFAVSLCSSQTINISGIVVDSTGTGIAGATVTLETAKITTTTGPNGNFTLNGTIVSIQKKNQQLLTKSAQLFIANNQLYVNCTVRTIVNISVYSAIGRFVSNIQETKNAGTHPIVLPNLSSGVYIYKVEIDKDVFSFIHTLTGGTALFSGLLVDFKSHECIAKKAISTAVINDVIVVTKIGYLNYRENVLKADTTGIKLKMIICNTTVSDIEGNIYQAVKIGNQIWTAENLRTTKYNDGTSIVFDTSSVNWKNTKLAEYCYYNNTNNTDTIRRYGALYNFNVINTKKLAPAGWHVSTKNDWDTLQIYLTKNGYNWYASSSENTLAKSLASKTDWLKSEREATIGWNLTQNNKSGFSAFPSGKRSSAGRFSSVGNNGLWWCPMDSCINSNGVCTVANYSGIYNDQSSLERYSGVGESNTGHCVRLVKD